MLNSSYNSVNKVKITNHCNQKMDRRPKDTFLQRRHANGQQRNFKSKLQCKQRMQIKAPQDQLGMAVIKKSWIISTGESV